MLLARRPAGRFFVAFYQWSRYTQGGPGCTFGHQRPNALRNTAGYDGCNGSRSFGLMDLLKSKKELVKNEEPESAIPGAEKEGRQDEVEKGSCENGGEKEGSKPHEPETPVENDNGTSPSKPAGPKNYTPPTTPKAKLDLSPDQLRKFMRVVPHPVVLITAASYALESGDKAAPRAMAVSSFNTVTLNPPTISFNVRLPSKTMGAIRANHGRFRVHFLTGYEKGARVADLFTRGNMDEAWETLSKLEGVSSVEHFHDRKKTLAPLIRGSAIAAHIECEILRQMVVADHQIIAAKVLGMSTDFFPKHTLHYVQGAYKGSGANTILTRNAEGTPHFYFYDLPVFPTEEDRQTLVGHIDRYLSNDPSVLDMPLEEVVGQIHTDFGIPKTEPLGVNIPAIVAKAATLATPEKERRPKKAADERTREEPVTFDFFGRLSPADVDTIVNRAKTLVRKDPLSLLRPWNQFYNKLGVSEHCNGLLAGDILEPLRAEGLVEERFKPAPIGKQLHRIRPYHVTLGILEQAEHMVRERFRKEDPEAAQSLSMRSLVEHSPTGWLEAYMKYRRDRLLEDVAPQVFDDTKVDIRGEVTEAERRVILSRVIHFALGGHKAFRLPNPPLGLLDRNLCQYIRIHPLVSGINIAFIRGKIQAMYVKAENDHDFSNMVNHEIRWKWLEREVSYAEYERRIHEYALQDPSRAVRWLGRDLLPAIGLDRSVFVHDAPRGIGIDNRGHGHRIILQQALRKQFPDPEKVEDQEIAAFLQATLDPYPNRPGVFGKEDSEDVDSEGLDSEEVDEADGEEQENNFGERDGTIVRVAVEGDEDNIVPSFRIRKNTVAGFEGPENPAETLTPAREPKTKGFTPYGFDGKKS